VAVTSIRLKGSCRFVRRPTIESEKLFGSCSVEARNPLPLSANFTATWPLRALTTTFSTWGPVLSITSGPLLPPGRICV
jgi:hypothetical protein